MSSDVTRVDLEERFGLGVEHQEIHVAAIVPKDADESALRMVLGRLENEARNELLYQRQVVDDVSEPEDNFRDGAREERPDGAGDDQEESAGRTKYGRQGVGEDVLVGDGGGETVLIQPGPYETDLERFETAVADVLVWSDHLDPEDHSLELVTEIEAIRIRPTSAATTLDDVDQAVRETDVLRREGVILSLEDDQELRADGGRRLECPGCGQAYGLDDEPFCVCGRRRPEIEDPRVATDGGEIQDSARGGAIVDDVQGRRRDPAHRLEEIIQQAHRLRDDLETVDGDVPDLGGIVAAAGRIGHRHGYDLDPNLPDVLVGREP